MAAKSKCKSEPISIMHILERDNKKFFVNSYVNTERIFAHPEVADRKIVVLTTIGAFRKGKSFALDYFLRFLYANFRSINKPQAKDPNANWMGSPDEPLNKGFSWAHGRKANTKGIIMWSDVFLHDTPTEKIAIVLMDTQGLFEGGSTPDENARIFGLSTLIASIQVINIAHLIQEDQIEYLHMATSLSQMVLQKDQKDGGSSKLFQKLVFLLRDWTDEETGFGFNGGEIYLNEFLSQDSLSSNAKNVRDHIRESFDDVKCCLLPHPGKEIGKQKYDGRHGLLDPVFVVCLKELIESVLDPSNLVKKSILGREVTGREFLGFINSYFEAFASEDIPRVESILEVTVRKQTNAITDRCIEAYHEKIKKSQIDFDIEPREAFAEHLFNAHTDAKNEVLKMFHDAPKIKSVSEDYEANLISRVGAFFENWKDDNLKNYERTFKMKAEIKQMKLSEEETKRRLEEIEEQARKESEKNAEERAIAEKVAKMQREREEFMERQIEDLKKRGFFSKVGDTIDSGIASFINACKEGGGAIAELYDLIKMKIGTEK